jgi:hypothetical protein
MAADKLSLSGDVRGRGANCFPLCAVGDDHEGCVPAFPQDCFLKGTAPVRGELWQFRTLSALNLSPPGPALLSFALPPALSFSLPAASLLYGILSPSGRASPSLPPPAESVRVSPSRQGLSQDSDGRSGPTRKQEPALAGPDRHRGAVALAVLFVHGLPA